jgi:hypothetical protein
VALFYTEFLALPCSDVESAKRWWISAFGAKQQSLPDWDDLLPSDVALKLPGSEEPNISLPAMSPSPPKKAAASRTFPTP